MRAGMRRALEAVVGAAVLAGAVAWLSGGCGERIAPGELPLPGTAAGDTTLVVVSAVTGPASEWATGAVASARQTAVSARTLARIEEVRVRAGSEVAQDDVLVVLDARDLEARDLEARAQEAREGVRAARARLELAGTEQRRAEELFRQGVATRQRLDEANSGLRVGQPLRVEIPALEARVEGRIDEIVPFAEPGARTLLVKVRLPALPGAFAGMFARIEVPGDDRTRLLVPATAIETIGQLEYVTAVTPEQRLERRLVTTGERGAAGRVEVLSGLAAGERVRVPAPAGGGPQARALQNVMATSWPRPSVHASGDRRA